MEHPAEWRGRVYVLLGVAGAVQEFLRVVGRSGASQPGGRRELAGNDLEPWDSGRRSRYDIGSARRRSDTREFGS
jgi:hypothetical protein